MSGFCRWCYELTVSPGTRWHPHCLSAHRVAFGQPALALPELPQPEPRLVRMCYLLTMASIGMVVSVIEADHSLGGSNIDIVTTIIERGGGIQLRREGFIVSGVMEFEFRD